MQRQQTIAIIGAGLAGLTAGHYLNDHYDVHIFEKSRGVSGRMATRYTDRYEFDHGAQSFSVRSDTFGQFLKPFIAAGLIANWPDRQRFVAVPRMNALGKAIAKNLNVTLASRITHMSHKDGGWVLKSDQGAQFGPFDQVICACPAPQALELLPKAFSAYEYLSAVRMLPAFTVMAGLLGSWPLDWTYKRFKDSPIGQISVNVSKPGRDRSDVAGHGVTNEREASVVIQADNSWAAQHITLEKQIVMSRLLEEFEQLTELDISGAPHLGIHRWLYANVGRPAGHDFLRDPVLGLAACGDWAIEGRVEAAFLSGHHLAEAMLAAPVGSRL